MALVENSTLEAPITDKSVVTPKTAKERPQLNLRREEYLKLHRLQNPTNNVENLRNHFEKEPDSVENQGPKPKIQLVNKADLIREEEGDPKDEGNVNEIKDQEIPVPKKRLSKTLVAETGTLLEEKNIKQPLRKSFSTDTILLKETKAQKRVSFSFETNNESAPVPKPRTSAPIQQVIVEKTIIEPEILSVPEIVTLDEPHIQDTIDFAPPEDRHHLTRHNDFAVESIENIKKALDDFTMDTKKKRSPSFRSKLLTIFTKDKDKKPKDKGEPKKTKKTENAVFADNAQNENFNRHSTQRHTIDAPRREPKPLSNHQIQTHQQCFQDEMHPDQKDLEARYAASYIQKYQQARKTYEMSQPQNFDQQMQQQKPQHLPTNSFQDRSGCSHNEDYVCMDNKAESNNVPKYDSSSTNTIESENSTTSVNQLQQLQQERMAIRTKFFNETGTPPRAQDTNQNVQLINPKAAVSINSERPMSKPYQVQQPSPQLRNESPYQMQQQQHQQRFVDDNDLADSGYGTVYDRNSRPMSAGSSDISGGSMSSPRSPSVERTKLKLPQNREKIELQPRLKSPIPPNEISTDKLIATELLKANKKNDKKERDRSSPSHQKLQLEIDYPELHETICDVVDQGSIQSGRSSANHFQGQNELSITSIHKNDVSSSSFNATDHNINSNNVSNSYAATNEVTQETLLEAGDWHRMQRDLASSPSLKNVQITTNALVHVDSPHRTMTPSNDGRSRSVTPVMMMRRNSNSSLQRSPPKHEIRQNVEAFCWKELKKMKEQEDQQMQMLVGPMISSHGYAEDPIRRSRRMAVTPRDTRRSTSLPRELRQRRVEDIELNARRMAQQQRFNSGPQRGGGDGQTRPIFNRGSLTQQNVIDQPIYNKKVSFRNQNTQNPISWPTKNGFTQSPPQRRLDAHVNGSKETDTLEDDVFLPQTPKDPQRAPSRNEIFLLNQQRQKELLIAKAQKSNAPVVILDSASGSVVDSGSVISDVPPMRNIREPIYGTRPIVPVHSQMANKIMNENPYGTRSSPQNSNSTIINEPIYGIKNGNTSRVHENHYNPQSHNAIDFSRQNLIRNESIYGTRQPMPNSEGLYGSRQIQNENPYGTRPGPPAIHGMNISSYGPRMSPNGMQFHPREDSIYGSRSSSFVSHDVYGSKASVVREPIYGLHQMPLQRMESPYGTRQNHNGQRFLPGYPPPGHQEPIYGMRGVPSTAEPIYGYRMSSGESLRAESPYGVRPPLPMGSNQQYYNRPRLSPSNGGPPLPPAGPGRANIPPGLKRSNSLRQPGAPESLYDGRPNVNKPPSGAQYRQRGNMPQMDLSPTGQRNLDPPPGRYDFPPAELPPRNEIRSQTQQEPIYGTRKVNTINNKVCDIYGKIYDANKPIPMSPPPSQKAGVLYGQLQRNSNAPPVVYQSYQQLQPNGFQRGTRLTASVNDMHRYNSNGNMGAMRTEPPSRPLPPIPDEQPKKSLFGFGRKKNENKGK